MARSISSTSMSWSWRTGTRSCARRGATRRARRRDYGPARRCGARRAHARRGWVRDVRTAAVVMLTASDAVHMEACAVRAGATLLLHKPCSADRLALTIDAAID